MEIDKASAEGLGDGVDLFPEGGPGESGGSPQRGSTSDEDSAAETDEDPFDEEGEGHSGSDHQAKGDGADDDEGDERLFDEDEESEEEGGKEKSPEAATQKARVLRERLERANRQRREARSSEQKVRETLAELQQEHRRYEDALKGWEGLFGGYEDPLEAAQRHIRFVAAAQTLADQDRNTRDVIDGIFGEMERLERQGSLDRRQFARGGRVEKSQQGAEATKAEAGEEKGSSLAETHRDLGEALIENILEKAGVEKEYRRAIVRSASASGQWKERPTRAAMRDLVRETIDDLGWDPKRITGEKKRRGGRPPTGRGGNASFRRARGDERSQRSERSEEGVSGKAPEKPTTPAEGQRARSNIFARFLKEAEQRA